MENKLTCVSRHATPYHAPVYLAQKMGYFADEGIKVALLEPNDPSGEQFLLPSDTLAEGNVFHISHSVWAI
jgi:hypothetical protein